MQLRGLLLFVLLSVGSLSYAPGLGYEQLSNDIFSQMKTYYQFLENQRLLPYLKRRLPFPVKSLNKRLLSQLRTMRRINY